MDEKTIPIDPLSWVRVRVTNKGKSLKDDGKLIPSGETHEMQHFRAEAHVKAGIVTIIELLPDYDPAKVPTEALKVDPPKKS